MPGRASSIREALVAALRDGPATLRDLSAAVSIREKEVADHLPHVARSVVAAGGKWVVTPSRCKGCGFEFVGRDRVTTPSRCPECRSERIEAAVFRIE